MHYPTDPAAVREAIDALRAEVEWLRGELSGVALDPVANEIRFHVRGLTSVPARFLAAIYSADRVSMSRLRHLVPKAENCSDNLLLVHISRAKAQLAAAGAPAPAIERRGVFFVLTPAAREWLAERLNTTGAHHDHSRSHASSAGTNPAHQSSPSRA